jgi:hypothetical protein
MKKKEDITYKYVCTIEQWGGGRAWKYFFIFFIQSVVDICLFILSVNNYPSISDLFSISY